MSAKKNIINAVFLLALFLLAFALLYLSFFKPLMQDEGVFLTIADGVLNGKIPHKDFFDHKPPGIYLLLAPIISLFGTNIWALKSFLFLNNFLAAFLVYKITNRIVSSSFTSSLDKIKWQTSPGILAALLFLFTGTFFEMNYLIAEPFMATFLLAAVYFFFNSKKDAIQTPSFSKKRNLLDSSSQASQNDRIKINIFLCGSFLGLAMLMKQTAIVNFLVLGWVVFKYSNVKEEGASHWIPAFAGMTKRLRQYLLGVILIWIPVFIYLFVNDVLGDAYKQMIIVNLANYPRESLSEVLKYISGTFKQTLPVWILFLFYLILSFLRKQKCRRVLTNSWFPASAGMTERVLLAFIFLPIPLLLVRHYPHYWLQIIPFVSILAGIQLHTFLHLEGGFKPTPSRWDGFWPNQNNTLRILILILIISSFYSNLRWFHWMTENQNRPMLKEQLEAAEYLKNLPQKNLLVENQVTSFYFLTEKGPLTKYLYITEVNEREEAEQKTIEALKSNPDTIIMWPKDTNFAYAKELQKYILKNYKLETEFPLQGLVIYKKQ